jgi:hypothetical protein
VAGAGGKPRDCRGDTGVDDLRIVNCMLLLFRMVTDKLSLDMYPCLKRQGFES